MLFHLYHLNTDDWRSNQERRHIIKYADDSVMINLLNDHDTGNGQVVEDLVYFFISTGECWKKLRTWILIWGRPSRVALPPKIPARNWKMWIQMSGYNFAPQTEMREEYKCSLGKGTTERVFSGETPPSNQGNKTILTLFYRYFITDVLLLPHSPWSVGL